MTTSGAGGTGTTGTTASAERPFDDLRREVDRCGYYPDLVIDSVQVSLADEPVVSFLVHHEATFDLEELRRHITVLILTPTRLIVGHTDEHPADEHHPIAHATTSTEAVRIDRIDTVVVSRVIEDPASYSADVPPREVLLNLGWGAVSRLDLEPANCGDPECEADHGYAGTVNHDDFTLRISADADGIDSISQSLEFAAALSRATTAH
jgi:hypothetical protein